MISASSSSASILFIAGEPSGDQRGAELIRHLKQRDPSLSCYGFGGPLMIREGLDPGEDITPHAVTGFIEVVRHLPSLRRLFRRILEEVRRRRPRAVVMIDYPGMNLRLLGPIKSMGVPVIYYISPQVWAWNRKRVALIRKHVDKMIVLFAFEQTFYEQHGVPAVWCGHPLMDALPLDRYPPRLTADELPEENRVALLPGSRTNEIKRLWPLMRACAERLHNRFGRALRMSVVASPVFHELLAGGGLSVPDYIDLIHAEQRYEHLYHCRSAVVASGTATLEAALLNCPMVVIYRIHPLTWMVARRLVTGIPGVALCNIVAGEKIVPELLQDQAKPDRINPYIESFLSAEGGLPLRRRLHERVRRALGPPGAAGRAAEAVLEFLNTR